MSGDLEAMKYSTLREEDVRLPASRGRVREGVGRRTAKLMGLFLGAMAIVVLLVPERPWIFEAMRQPQVEQGLPLSDSGLLADVRGEDTLHWLTVTLAALKGEVAFLRGLASEGHDAESIQSGMARLLSELEAGHAHLGAAVGRLEARQMALRQEIARLETVLATFAERFGQLYRLEERD